MRMPRFAMGCLFVLATLSLAGHAIAAQSFEQDLADIALTSSNRRMLKQGNGGNGGNGGSGGSGGNGGNGGSGGNGGNGGHAYDTYEPTTPKPTTLKPTTPKPTTPKPTTPKPTTPKPTTPKPTHGFAPTHPVPAVQQPSGVIYVGGSVITTKVEVESSLDGHDIQADEHNAIVDDYSQHDDHNEHEVHNEHVQLDEHKQEPDSTVLFFNPFHE